jgi:DHA1 family multidrug resistance protein-like MFS transporter
LIIAAVLYFGQSFSVMGWHLLVLQALVGFMLGGILPGVSALLARYTEVGEEGAVFGLDNSVQAGARTVAPLIGASIANLISLRATFMAAALIYLVTALLAAWGLPVTKKTCKCIRTL